MASLSKAKERTDPLVSDIKRYLCYNATLPIHIMLSFPVHVVQPHDYVAVSAAINGEWSPNPHVPSYARIVSSMRLYRKPR